MDIALLYSQWIQHIHILFLGEVYLRRMTLLDRDGINSQSLEDTQVGYILQIYTLAQKSLVMVASATSLMMVSTSLVTVATSLALLGGHQRRLLDKYTFGKYTFGKYIFGKYTFGKYTFGKYTFGKYTFGIYTFGKYTFGKYALRFTQKCKSAKVQKC